MTCQETNWESNLCVPSDCVRGYSQGKDQPKAGSLALGTDLFPLGYRRSLGTYRADFVNY